MDLKVQNINLARKAKERIKALLLFDFIMFFNLPVFINITIKYNRRAIKTKPFLFIHHKAFQMDQDI